jgi:hypothetical protein
MRTASRMLALCVLLGVAPVAFGSPIVGTSANTLPKGKFVLDIWATWLEYDKVYNYDLDGQGHAGWIALPDNIAYTSASFVPRLLYGVTDWLTLRVAVPLEDRFTDFPDDEGQATSTGLGDVVIDPKILMYRSESGSQRVSLLAGIRLPTGDTGSDIPLSDGSTDFSAGFAATHKAGDFAAHLCSVYWFNGESESGVDMKDQSITTVTLEDALNANWSLEWEARATLGQDPTKYYRVYVCPGISWTDGGKLTVGLSGLVSVAAKGCPAISTYDFGLAPYFRLNYAF